MTLSTRTWLWTFDQVLAMLPQATRCGPNEYRSCCPAHGGANPTSLSIREGIDGVAKLKCFARGCHSRDIIAALGAPPSVATVKRVPRESFDPRPTIKRIWEEARPIYGSRAEGYLEMRGINKPVPTTVRFHPELLHPNGEYYPAIVAAVCVGTEDNVEGIHRTFLRSDGLWKADIFPNKMRLGAVPGGTIRLGPAAQTIVMSEGLEDGLTLRQHYLEFDEDVAVWVSMGATQLSRAWLPPLPKGEIVVIASDNDPAGYLAIEDCVREFNSQDREVRIIHPNDQFKDFNAELMSLEGLDSHA